MSTSQPYRMKYAQSDRNSRSIELRYFIRIPNVGDRINPNIIGAITGRECNFARSKNAPHLLAIGSLMAGANPFSRVWGTGVMHPDFGIGEPKAENIYALRGKLTYAAVKQSGIGLQDIPLGDPAYLSPQLLGFQRMANPAFKLGVVSHYVDRQNPLITALLNDDEVVDLNVHESPDIFLSKMAKCSAVISTSLHGLIFAEALKIPNLWVKVSDKIGGGEFRFKDWFSINKNPQKLVHILSQQDTVAELCARSVLHQCCIDSEALLSAFPVSSLIESSQPKSSDFISVDQCRSRPMPCFVISYNRGTMLKSAIHSVQQQNRSTSIIVHDNGSTDLETLRVLDELNKANIKVVYGKPIKSPDELNCINSTIEEYFKNWAEPARYLVTDCDIDLGIANADALDVYDDLLNIFNKLECVGPMLRIWDIPPSYPLYSHVMNRHIEQFWQKLPTILSVRQQPVAVIEAAIDTTLAMHRAGEKFRRLKSGLRVYEPFEALHLDWYEDIKTDYTWSSSPLISHWNNDAYLRAHEDELLRYSHYYAVHKTDATQIEIRSTLVPPRNPGDH